MRSVEDSQEGNDGPPGRERRSAEDERQPMVLLIDDQAIVAHAIRKALAIDPAISLHHLSRPEGALETIRAVKPSVILLDLIMPDRDGLSILAEVRGTGDLCNIPVIVLSTRDDPYTKKQAFEAKANDYLVKVPDSLELVARVRYHSEAYGNRIQRDEAYQALQRSQALLLERNNELESALADVKRLERLLPICARCKVVRQEDDYRQEVESYLAGVLGDSSCVCPECAMS